MKTDRDRATGTKGCWRGRVVALLVLAVIIVDQGTKAWASTALLDGPIPLVGDRVALLLAFNPSNSFGVFPGSTSELTLLGLSFTGFLAFMLWRADNAVEQAGIALMLAGAAGNLLDRLTQAPEFMGGYVVDFVHIDPYATFNFADVAIVSGVTVLVVGGTLRVVHQALRHRARSAPDTPAA